MNATYNSIFIWAGFFSFFPAGLDSTIWWYESTCMRKPNTYKKGWPEWPPGRIKMIALMIMKAHWIEIYSAIRWLGAFEEPELFWANWRYLFQMMTKTMTPTTQAQMSHIRFKLNFSNSVNPKPKKPCFLMRTFVLKCTTMSIKVRALLRYLLAKVFDNLYLGFI